MIFPTRGRSAAPPWGTGRPSLAASSQHCALKLPTVTETPGTTSSEKEGKGPPAEQAWGGVGSWGRVGENERMQKLCRGRGEGKRDLLCFQGGRILHIFNNNKYMKTDLPALLWPQSVGEGSQGSGSTDQYLPRPPPLHRLSIVAPPRAVLPIRAHPFCGPFAQLCPLPPPHLSLLP